MKTKVGGNWLQKELWICSGFSVPRIFLSHLISIDMEINSWGPVQLNLNWFLFEQGVGQDDLLRFLPALELKLLFNSTVSAFWEIWLDNPFWLLGKFLLVCSAGQRQQQQPCSCREHSSAELIYLEISAPRPPATWGRSDLQYSRTKVCTCASGMLMLPLLEVSLQFWCLFANN